MASTISAAPRRLPHLPHLRPAAAERIRRGIGGFYLVTSGIHIGLVAADAQTYRGFGDAALSPIHNAWGSVFMAHPAGWGLAVAAGELLIGILLLRPGRAGRLGLAGAIAFHLCLLLFGWWVWCYAVPALVLLVAVAQADLASAGQAEQARPRVG